MLPKITEIYLYNQLDRATPNYFRNALLLWSYPTAPAMYMCIMTGEVEVLVSTDIAFGENPQVT